MGDSLQEQLRALGLARERTGRPGREAKPESAAKASAGSGRGPRRPREPSLKRAYALREREEQQRAQRARDRKRAEDRRRRELNRAIREIVSARRENREDAEVAWNFIFAGRIRKVHVTAEQQKALAAGDLGIVYLSGGYHLLPSQSVARVREISPDHVVDAGQAGDADDSDHPVPDDLVW